MMDCILKSNAYLNQRPISNPEDLLRNNEKVSAEDHFPKHGSDQKITVIFKFYELHIFDFIIFYCYVGTHVCYIC